ncbi:MAG: hydroxyethylthiazole kinase [Bacillota bacterium]|nr:hydroxyethylthiazole kinase [Bacillota bacterium]
MSTVRSPGSILEDVRRKRPLVHQITNFVVMNLTANAVIAAGGLPVMAIAPEEAQVIARAADALVLNMGTPQRYTQDAMVLAGEAANQKGIPVVFDPVGAGLSPFRDNLFTLVSGAVRLTVIRGNLAEVSCLAGLRTRMRGVTAIGDAGSGAGIARVAAAQLAATVAVTGKVDHASDGVRLASCENGHEMMALVSGSGCVVSALVGLFCAVEPDSLVAAASALAYAGVAGERAARVAAGPASFQVNWLDELWRMKPSELDKFARIRWETE